MPLYVVRHPNPDQAVILRRMGFEVIEDDTPIAKRKPPMPVELYDVEDDE